jgi:hypothetical protein
LSTDEKNILKLMAENELAIKKLYDHFAEQFPEARQLWQRMAVDEKKHADWLDMLRFEPVLAGALSRDCRITPQSVKSSISYIGQLLEKAQTGEYGLIQAFSLSRDLENSLLEKQFANISQSAPRKIREVLQQLAFDTQRHRRQIEDALRDRKPNGQ